MTLPRMRLALQSLLVVAIAARESSQQDLPFSIQGATFAGTGCPKGTADIDLMQSGGFVFHGWNLTIGLGDGKDIPSASCHMQISITDIPPGYNLVVGDAQVSGNAGMDPGVQATIATTTSWSGASSEMKTDESMIFGSAAGVQFLNMFMVNPVFDNQGSTCGLSSTTLFIDLKVTMSQDAEEGATGKGVCNVEFAGVLAGLQPCKSVVEPVPAPDKR